MSSPELEEQEEVFITDPNIGRAVDPEVIIKFIQRVKTLPILYHQDHEHFRNTGMKQQAWKQVAQEFGQSERWCIRKWVSLRDYFVKRKKRLRSGKPSRPWIYYNELSSFLNDIYGDDLECYSSFDGYSNTFNGTENTESGLYYENEGTEDTMNDNDTVGQELETLNHLQQQDGFIRRTSTGTGLTITRTNNLDMKSSQEQYDQETEEVEDYEYQIRNPVKVEVELRQEDNDERILYPRQINRGTKTDNFRVSSASVSDRRSRSLVVKTNHHSQDFTATTSKTPIPNKTFNRRDNGGHGHFNRGSRNDNEEGRSQGSLGFVVPLTSKRARLSNTISENGPDQIDQEDPTSGMSETTPFENGHNPHPLKPKKCSLPHFSTSDPYDLFCLSVSAQLKRMPKDRAMVTQIEIMNLLYQAQFSDQRNGE